MRLAALALGVVLVLAACAGRGGRAPASSELPAAAPSAVGAPDTADGAVAWRHLAMDEGMLNGGVAAEAVEDADALEAAWRRYRLDGDPPEVDFTDHVVLLLLQPDDACPDELVGLDVAVDTLAVQWLAPPGGCDQPLIFRVHAVEVHRGHVPSTFTVALEEPFADEAEPAVIRLTPYGGGSAPPAPEPRAAMTEEEVAAVFEGHPVRRCTVADEVVPPLPPGTVVDERQEGDEEAMMDRVIDWLRREGWDLDREVVPIMDRHDNLRPHLRVDADRAEALQRQVDAEFGAGAVVVDPNLYVMAEIAAAQDAVRPLMGGPNRPGRIFSSTGIPGPVKLGMVDPTRAALDEIAATVDPSLVCVEVALSGVGEAPVSRLDG